MKEKERGRAVFSKYKSIIVFMAKIIRILPLRFRIYLFESYRDVRGRIGLGMRYILLKSIAVKCGDNVAIFPNAYILHPQYLSVGNNVSIHPFCYIECGHIKGENVVIEDNVSIAHGVTILATTHLYSDVNLPIRDQGYDLRPVYIKQNNWIGAKATILCGVTVDTGCVIGANAVVTKDTSANKVYAGVPARIIKDRNSL